MGDLYAGCVDTSAIDARGLSPLTSDLTRVAAIKSRRDLNSALVAFQLMGRPRGELNGNVIGFFRFTSGQDSKDPTRTIARIVERDSSGRTPSSIFSLPDRDYYLKEDARSRETRAPYLDHIARMLVLSGIAAAQATEEANAILALETSIAGSAMTIAERRDPDKTCHLMNLKQLAALAPDFDWTALLRSEGLPESAPINVTEPDLVRKFNERLGTASIETWKAWLRWRVVATAAPLLSKPFADESFRFNSSVLAGVTEQPPRWQTCARLVDRDLSDALGAACVGEYFPPQAKQRMLVLVQNLKEAMRDELENSDWVEPSTKKSAVEKLAALQVQVGYPDRWKNYAEVEVDRAKFYESVRSAWKFGQHYEIDRIGKPADRVDWAMNAPTVNAYSNPGELKVVFPAGILAPPFFDMEADDAANYGAIGAVIGHEMGHQFDDGGSKCDAKGMLNSWWTDKDRREFDRRTGCVIAQFNTFDVGNGLHHNGKQVLGEALGDLNGLRTSYVAWKHSLAGKPEPPVLDGFTAEQRFFVAFARVFGTEYRPEAIRLQLNTNNHPVSKFRVIGTLQNMPEFREAFRCKLSDSMTRGPEQQCKLW